MIAYEMETNKKNYSTKLTKYVKRILLNTGITKGICLDVGSKNYDAGLTVYENTGMFVYLMDNSYNSLRITESKNTKSNSRIKITYGDVHKIPLDDETVNLVISYDPKWLFESDFKKAVTEIYRVLSKNAYAYIGIDIESNEFKSKITIGITGTYDERLDRLVGEVNLNFYHIYFCKILKEMDINFKIIDEDQGFWIMLYKP